MPPLLQRPRVSSHVSSQKSNHLLSRVTRTGGKHAFVMRPGSGAMSLSARVVSRGRPPAASIWCPPSAISDPGQSGSTGKVPKSVQRKSWSKLTDADTAARRAGGRTHYNRKRQWEATKRRGEVLRLVAINRLERGSQAEMARQLGVHRSTITRDLQAVFYPPGCYLNIGQLGPTLTLQGPPERPPGVKELLADLEPFRRRLVARKCDCPEEEREEPRHGFLHVLDKLGAVLDSANRGKIELSEEQIDRFTEQADKLRVLLVEAPDEDE